MRSLSISISALLPVPSGAESRSRWGTPRSRATWAQAWRDTAWARSLVRRPAPWCGKRGKRSVEIDEAQDDVPEEGEALIRVPALVHPRRVREGLASKFGR